MPQLLPAAAAWAAAAWSSAVAATAAGVTAATAGAIAGTTATAVATAGLKFAVTTALSAAATALMRPNVPSTGTTLDFKPDPKAPVRGAMGYTAVGGNKAFQATWGYNRVAMSLGVALSLGPIDAVTQFQADGSAVAFTGAQGEATGFYAKDMWQRTTLGLPGDAALLPPTGFKYGTPGLTGWGSQHAAPQVSFAFWTMLLAKNPEDRDVYTNGVPDPRWIGRWMKVWNPRRDDTYPGGSGPQRRDDWRTWEWSENPYVHALAWYRGHFKLNLDGSIDRTKRIAGIGAPDAALDLPAFVEGMNVADANGWTISGEWASTDPKAQVAMAMLQAGGGQPINRGAQISVLVNMPRVSTYTYTKADLIGQATIRPLTPRRDRKNTIIPRFKSEANNWEYVAAGEVSDAGYRAEDRDEPRTVEVEYVHVRNAKQAGQLAAYDLVTLREGLTVTLPSKVHLMHVHAGDCITVDEPELAMVGQKFVVMRTTTDYKSATVTLELRSETDAKHAFALGQVAKAPPSPTLSAVDPKYMAPPVAIDWTITPRPPVPGGTSQPVIIIDGQIETSDVASVIIEHGPTADGPWTLIYSGAPSIDGRYEGKSLVPGAEYWIAVRHVAKNGATSERMVQGPYPAPDLVADVMPNAPGLSQIKADIEAAFGDIFAVDALLADARADIDAQGVEIAAARGGQPNLNSRIVQVNQARIDGDTANATAITNLTARTALTEADVIDLENAAANDRTATAQAIQQVTAQLAPALNKNSTFAAWPSGQSTPNNIGSFGSGLTVSKGVGKVSANSIILEAAAGSSNNGVEVAYTAANWNGRMPVVAGAAAYWVIDYKIEIGTGGLNGPMLRFLLTNAATGASLSSTIQKPLADLHTSTGDDQIIEGAYFFRCDLPAASPPASARLALFARAGAVANYNRIIAHKLAVRPATAAEISAQVALPATQATVTINSLAIVDLENQQALAYFSQVAAATGGLPAFVELLSSTLGGRAALAGPVVALLNTVAGGDPLVALQAIGGEVFFPRPIYVDLGGRRLIMGPGNGWVLWFGPATISAASATRTNGYFSLGSDGKVYYGSAELNGSGGFHAQADAAIRTGSRTSPGLVTTSTLRITVSGATGAVNWQGVLMGGADDWVITNASGIVSGGYFETAFRASVSTPGEQKRAQFAFLVTDTGSGRSYTIPVAAAAIYNV